MINAAQSTQRPVFQRTKKNRMNPFLDIGDKARGGGYEAGLFLREIRGVTEPENNRRWGRRQDVFHRIFEENGKCNLLVIFVS